MALIENQTPLASGLDCLEKIVPQIRTYYSPYRVGYNYCPSIALINGITSPKKYPTNVLAPTSNSFMFSGNYPITDAYEAQARMVAWCLFPDFSPKSENLLKFSDLLLNGIELRVDFK